MKIEKTQQKQKEDKTRVKLRDRLSLNNIHRQLQLIANMNKHLQIPIEPLMRMDILQTLSKEEVIKLIQNISFLKYFKKSEHSMKQCVRLQYENASRILLVTGIHKEFVDGMLSQFNNNPRRMNQLFNSRSPFARTIAVNQFWVSIQASSEEAASALKKYLRNEKRNMDDNNKKGQYKIQRRRIRIIIVKEDLFTLLVDAMSEIKTEMFQNQFQFGLPTLEKKKSQNNNQDPGIIYRSIAFNNLQSYSYRNENKEEDFSDGFSESNSLNSDLFDPNKIKDIIETSDQGIQSEGNAYVLSYPPSESQENNNDSPQHSPIRADLLQKNAQQPKEPIQHQKQLFSGDESKEFKPDIDQQASINFSNFKTNIECAGKDNEIAEETRQLYLKEYQNRNNSGSNINQSIISSTAIQTQGSLYTILPDHLMRRFLQQFKNKSHSQLVQLPDWLKSESENERNRHRFFSSLCKPKLIHKRQPF